MYHVISINICPELLFPWLQNVIPRQLNVRNNFALRDNRKLFLSIFHGKVRSVKTIMVTKCYISGSHFMKSLSKLYMQAYRFLNFVHIGPHLINKITIINFKFNLFRQAYTNIYKLSFPGLTSFNKETKKSY